MMAEGLKPRGSNYRNVPIPTGRYRMLFHHLHSYPKYIDLPMHFHHYPAFGTFSSASQVQIDVKERDLIPVFRSFSRLEPVKALLFFNSVLLEENEQMICARDMFWENSTHGINPHNVGMYECDSYSEEELLAPLYDRWRRCSNPALDMLHMLEEGGTIEEVIRLYA